MVLVFSASVFFGQISDYFVRFFVFVDNVVF